MSAILDQPSPDLWRVSSIKLPKSAASSLTLVSGDYPLLRGQDRVLSLTVRSESPRSVTVKVVSSDDKPKDMGLHREVTMSETEVTYRLPFRAESNDLSARVVVEFGQSNVPFEISGVRLNRKNKPEETDLLER